VQAQCSQCSSRIQIDDSKVPDKPFKVKCPKCQAVITLPGKGAAPAGNGGAEAAAAPPPAPAPTQAYEPPPVPSAAAVARRERAAASQNDALIALSGPAAAVVQTALVNIGYNVDVVDDVEEGVRLVEQGVYELAVTSRVSGDGGKETLHQRLMRLATDYRRGLFVILVGEEFRTGDGTQAWVAQADLVIHPNDAARSEHLIRSTIQERKRLYLPLHDARKRIENS
jgi:predicted Zn finger-like uncharacterized protein